MPFFVGIDPGFGGAIAIVGNPALVYDTPTYWIKGVKKRREYDIREMARILNIIEMERENGNVRVVIEKVSAMPGQGVCSMFSFGRGVGIWEGLLTGLGFSYELVTPQRWQKTMMDGLPRGKGASIAVAKRLFPSVDLNRAKDHGRADALLLAEYGRRSNKP